MKVSFIAFTSIRGGAAKATRRIIKSLEKSDCDISFFSIERKTPFIYKVLHYAGWVFSQTLTKLQWKKNGGKYSLNAFGSLYIKKKVKEENMLHIHWINNETLNIKDFSLLSKKSVITLHDEWFYCGAEHYALDSISYDRVVNGYTKKNKNVKGLDVNRFVWQRKKKYYPSLNNVIFTVPSTWMMDRAKKSYLLKDKDICVVPNPIDTDIFRPNKTGFTIDGICSDDFVITFGAIGGGSSYIKGFDLLTEAIRLFSEAVRSVEKIKIIVFGGSSKKNHSMFGINVIELGHISSEEHLAHIYSLSSVTIVPSRAESFGQVAAESLSCETPVIAFNYSGLTDIIKHKENGYLAEPFRSSSLSEGILWFYSLSYDEKSKMGFSGRKHIISMFSEEVVGEKFLSIYKEIDRKNNKDGF